MSRFYMTLPSNSSVEYYPENTAACYTTKLADTVKLEGDWEVSLAEMSIPCAVYNIVVVANQCYYTISLDNVHFLTTVVPEDNYERLHALCDAKKRFKRAVRQVYAKDWSYRDGVHQVFKNGFFICLI